MPVPGAITRGVRKVASLLGANKFEPELTRSAAGEPKPARRPDEDSLLQLLNGRRNECRLCLAEVMPEVVIGLAYDSGRQWIEWKRDIGTTAGNGGQLIDTRKPGQIDTYRTVNLIRPRVLTNVARMTSGRPDVSIIPKSTREVDIEAAEEARLVVDHYERLHNGREQLRRIVHYNFCGTTAGLLFYWNPKAHAMVPSGDPEGGYVSAPVGEGCEKVVYGHQILIDPRVNDWRDARYIILEEWLPVSEVEERYGVKVDQDSANESPSFDLTLQVSTYLGGWWTQRVNPRAKKVWTYWEKPSGKYPGGRTIAFAQDQVLDYREDLPFASPETGEPGRFPLVLTGYQVRHDSPYHRNPVSDAAQPQFDYNTFRSLCSRGAKKLAKLYQTRRMDDAGGADVEEMVDEGPSIITLWYDVASVPPSFQRPEINLAELRNQMEMCAGEIDDILGVHSVSSGEGDPNASSGYAIRLLSDNDRTQQAPYLQAVERFVEERAAMRVAMAKAYVMEERAWGLDGIDNPEEAEERLSGLEALRAGGLAAIRIQESSGTPSTPEAMDEETMLLYDKGVLGDPASPEAHMMLLTLLHSPAAVQARAEILRVDKGRAAQGLPPYGTPPTPEPPPPLPMGAPPPPPPMSPYVDPLMPPPEMGVPGLPPTGPTTIL